MKEWIKPTIVLSKCLGESKCRYDGTSSFNNNVSQIKNFVNIIEVCPEEAIGMSTPRDPIRLVQKDNDIKLLQLKSGEDLTKLMNEFSCEFLTSMPSIDGFLLKSKSPSCGIKDIKVYNSIEKGPALISKGIGFFAKNVLERFPYYPLEDEGRLMNFSIRENFLTRIFLLASFKEIKKKQSLKALIEFHSNNKLLLMSYSQKGLKILGGLVANHDNKSIFNLLADYEKELFIATSRTPRYTSNINVLYHALGYFTENLTSREREFILGEIERYKVRKCPLSVPLTLIKSYAIRFNIDYLLNQTFLMPYPEDLMDISDSGKGVVH